MRNSKDITQEYNELCANLGHNLLQFEIFKSQAIAKFQELNKEMLEVAKVEEAEEAKVRAKEQAEQEQLVKLVEDVPRTKLDQLVAANKNLRGVR
jgi:hypothetical protein